MKMEEKKCICFNLLGSFSYAVVPVTANKPDSGENANEVSRILQNTGKKTLSVLQYLIVNHARNITAEELVDTFWTENESSDPANVLRNMIYKIRNLLKHMFPNEEEMLKTLSGCYAWNPNLSIRLDTQRFEEACLKAGKESGRACMEELRQAVSLYKGDFLAGNDSEWTREPRQYYRTLYLEGCKRLLPFLEEQEQWMQIVGICSQAYQVDFYMEEFTAYQMRALIAMGQPEQAVEKYRCFKERLLKELGLLPTEEIEQIHTLALGFCRHRTGDEEDIFRLVCEDAPAKQAFFCSFGVFQNIVALERRHLARSGHISTLVIVSLDGSAPLTTDVRRLERILQEGLRTGDPVARIAAGSYILMLTGANAEHAQVVTNRLACSFHKTYRHSNARLNFRLSALCPDGAVNK